MTINTINNVSVTDTRVNADAPAEQRYLCALKEGSMIGSAMTTMSEMMLLFSQLAGDKFEHMKTKMKVAREAQDMANRVEIALSDLDKPDSTGVLPPDIIEYMRNNKILVGDKTIDEFLGLSKEDQAKYDKLKGQRDNAQSHLNYWEYTNGLAPEHASKPSTVEWNKKEYSKQVNNYQARMDEIKTPPSKKQMESIKAALESAGGTASDYVQQSQLKLQQLMQNFNTTVTMANNIQSMNAESTKAIAQSIR